MLRQSLWFGGTCLCCLVIPGLVGQAQTAPGGKAQAEFTRFDKDADGRVSAAEAGHAAWFKAADQDADGFLTKDEGRAFAEARIRAKRSGGTKRSAGLDPAGEGQPSLVVKRDVAYGDEVDQNRSLDIYASKDAKNLPVMIYVHGGGWTRGDKSAVAAKPYYFAAQGFIFVSLNYRFVPAVDILTQLQDTANAIGWVHQHIADHGGDPTRLHLIGHSAGAHHVAVMATNDAFLRKAGVALSNLKSVVELDTQALNVVELLKGSANDTYRSAFGSDPSVWQQISPLDNIVKDKNIPPFFLVVAGGVPPKLTQAAAFQKALRSNGVRCEFFEALEHDHGSVNQSIGLLDDKVTQAMKMFHDTSESKSTTPSK